MPSTYAIADLHGRYDLLDAALREIAAHAGDRAHKIVTLGDYVDRGPQSRQIIERLIEEQARQIAERPFVCLKGNHEDIMRMTCRFEVQTDWWMSNGGGATLKSYSGYRARAHRPDLSVVKESHLAWIEALPLMHVDEHRVYVHAGVNRSLPLDAQRALTSHGDPAVLWMLYSDDDEGGHGHRHVIHGHHQFADGPIFKKGRTDLDTFAWATGRLVVGVFDDEIPGGPVECIEIKGEPDPRYVS